VTINQYLGIPTVLWLDTETTGVYENCDICQAAGIIEQEGSILATFVYTSRPFYDTLITSKALTLMNITRQELWSYPDPAVMYQQLASILTMYCKDGFALAGQCIHFDLRKMKRFLIKAHYDILLDRRQYHDLQHYDEFFNVRETFCTNRFARRLRRLGILPPGSNSLPVLAKELHCGNFIQHSAEEDIRMTRLVGYKLLEKKIAHNSEERYHDSNMP
jgi:hypothetical protein